MSTPFRVEMAGPLSVFAAGFSTTWCGAAIGPGQLQAATGDVAPESVDG